MPPENFNSQKYLDQLSEWTEQKKMTINNEKSKYMIVNFTRNYQFNTRLNIEGKLLNQVPETRLLGVIMDDKLSWQSNTDHLVKQAYKRMAYT